MKIINPIEKGDLIEDKKELFIVTNIFYHQEIYRGKYTRCLTLHYKFISGKYGKLGNPCLTLKVSDITKFKWIVHKATRNK